MVTRMAIVKKFSTDNQDRNGGLGNKVITELTPTLIYRVRYNARYCNSNINIVNPSPGEARVKVWVTYDNQPSDNDIIESSIVLAPDAVYIRTNIVLGPNEAVFVLSDTLGIICRVEGFENNLL